MAATDGSSSDLAFDPSDGHPAIAYSAADALKLARYNGTAWDIEVVDTGPGYGTRVALAFDPMTGSPAMLHVGDLDTVRFVLWDGSQWQKTDLDPTALMVLDCALWLDWDGTAWAAWGADDGLQWELKVRRRDPATGLWAAPEVVEDSPGLITHISLKRSPASGTLCISYSYGTGAHVHGSVEELRYATRGTP